MFDFSQITTGKAQRTGMVAIKINIFEYIDYRLYLKDYFELQKKNNPAFSHRYFMQKAGYKSVGLYSGIVNGSTNLSFKFIPKFAYAIKLNKHEQEYLKLLVLYDNADTAELKEERLNTIQAFIPKQHVWLKTYQKRYYKNWYTAAIREALCIVNIDENYEDMARFIRPTITRDEVEESIDILHHLGLIERDDDGFWKACDSVILAGGDVGKKVIQDYQASMIRMSEKALYAIPKEKRNITSRTFGLSVVKYQEFIEEIQKLYRAMSDGVETDSDETCVYQFNLQFFPLTACKSELQSKSLDREEIQI